MRQGASGGSYAAGTKINSHQSRAELARLLARYGAGEFVVLEHDANATIRFALHGKYVQYVLPLPDQDDAFFTHTPTGRPRLLSAQERVYEQAVRQQWRRAVLVMKGKLEAVESGLSSFEREFYGAIMDEGKRDRPAALLLRRRLRWAPETMLVAICLGILVPASGGLALGVPAVAVDKLAAPLWDDRPGPFADTSGEGSSQTRKALRLDSGKAAAPSPKTSVVHGGGSSDGSTVASWPQQVSAPTHAKGGSKGGSTGGSVDTSAGGGGSTLAPPPPPSPTEGGSGGSGGSDGGVAPPPPPVTPPPPPTGGQNDDPQKGLGSQGKGNGWDNGNKGKGQDVAGGGITVSANPGNGNGSGSGNGSVSANPGNGNGSGNANGNGQKDNGAGGAPGGKHK